MPVNEFRVRQEGTRVMILLDGRLVADLPWEKADALWKAIRAQTKRAEEEAMAQPIIMDQALLLRIGARLGLTNRADLQAAAGKEAAWNRDLRRYLPGGVKSQEAVGTPTLIQHPPRRGKHG